MRPEIPLALTLLVENNPKIIEIYHLNLTTYVGLELVVATTRAEAVQLIGQQPFKLIIARAKMGKDDIAVPVAERIKECELTTPLFVIGHGIYPALVHGVLPGSLDLKGVVKGSAQALGITAQQMVEKKVEDYFEFPARLIEWINYPVVNVYTRDDLGLLDLVFPANKEIDRTLLKNLQTLCVDKLDRLQIVNQITAELVVRLEDKDLNPDEQIQAGASNHELISKKLMSIGINEETIAMAKKSMNALVGNVKKYPKLGSLLQRMLANKAGYLYRHTQIVTYVSLHIVRNIDWGTPEQEDKISFICFFHDIALENDKQAQIKSKDELRRAEFDTREKNLVEKHAQLAAELVHKYPHAPMGADQIIRQHHGVLNGAGFSDHFGANLSPMAIVFIIAEEFTRIIIQSEAALLNGHQSLNSRVMIQELKTTFPTARFQKIIDLLETITF
jgi:HD-GYP domain-containing protein (c-di-GMP phosphodiesterase class II)